MISTAGEQDVLQVCRNGHVITDRLHSCGEQGLHHCDRCGATTVTCCATCGQALPGAVLVTGLSPIGAGRPPAYCSTCGAAFPWTTAAAPASDDALARLEPMLRRLPHVIRQLHSRHGVRPPFHVADQHDLEDLVRSLLPLHFDDIRLRSCTPHYALTTQTDLFLAKENVGLTVKVVRPPVQIDALACQLQEDLARWQAEGCRLLVAFLYDPEGLLRNAAALEAAWSQDGPPPLRCIIARP
jgi:hypothetical protein